MDNANLTVGSENSAKRKRELFDSVEIKGLSAKSARFFYSSRLSKAIRSFSKTLACTSARVYGLVFLSFGLLTLFLHLAEYYFMDDPAVEISSLVIGASFMLFSVFFLISDKPIGRALQSVAILDFLIFDLFSINRMHYRDAERGFGASIGIIFGFILSIFGFFFPTEYAVLLIIALVFFSVAMISPEFPYIFSLLIFPYLTVIPHSSYILAGLIALSVISFARKVLIGKRVYSFEIYDLVLIFFILTVLITSVFLGGSAPTESALLITVFIIGYIPASNMAVNRRIFDCISGAVTASAIPVSIYSVIDYSIRSAFFERRAAAAFFNSAETFAAYLFAVILLSVYLAYNRRRHATKYYYGLTAVLSFAALICTESFLIPIALAVAVAAVVILASKKAPKWTLLFLLFGPLLVFLLPSRALGWLSDKLSVSPSLGVRRRSIIDSLGFFGRNIFLGAGGGDSYDASLFGYNAYLGIACRFGILAVIAFIILLIVRMCHLGVFKKYYSSSAVAFLVDASSIALLLMLVMGSARDIFSQIEMVYYFIAIYGTGSAALRLSRKEREENLSYYKDLGRSDSADIDVFLND